MRSIRIVPDLIIASLMFAIATSTNGCRPTKNAADITDHDMRQVYDEIKTPYKYGVVIPQPDSSRLIDSPTIFQKEGRWFMTYIVFDGRGYETWLAQS
jgi:ABC-type uncharacterized transport system auxiliary subunit